MFRRLISSLFAAAVLSVTAADGEEIGDPEAGREAFQECAACHEIGRGAENRIGPHLNRIFGRQAGSLDDFVYSDGLARMGAGGLEWDLRTLDAYIANPPALVSGTRMNYPGMEDPDRRADLLAYLRQFSADPANIPEAAPTARPSEPDLDPDILAIEGDPAYGAYLSSECTTCHQRDGSDEGIPSITHWPEADFVAAMHAYKQKLRPHPVMQMIASRLSDEEIAALAAYFANPDQ
jgi:cytochrome c